MQNCSTGNKDEPSPSSLCDAASPERGGFALLTARWQNGESGEQSEMTGGVFHVLRPLRLLPLVAATSPKGRGKSSAGSFLIAPNTLATRAAACALSVKAYGFASSPKGRAKCTPRQFLVSPKALATSFTAWLSLRGKTSPAPGEDVTAGDKRGNLARERLRGRTGGSA